MVASCLLSTVLKLPARPQWPSVIRAGPVQQGAAGGHLSWTQGGTAFLDAISTGLWLFYTTWQVSHCAIVFN